MICPRSPGSGWFGADLPSWHFGLRRKVDFHDPAHEPNDVVPEFRFRDSLKELQQEGRFPPCCVRLRCGVCFVGRTGRGWSGAKEISDRNIERLGKHEQVTGANAIDTALVFLQLLERDADRLAEALLREAQRNPAQSNA
jgi:hypothetical protein